MDRLLLPLITNWWHRGRDVTHCSVSAAGRYWHLGPALGMVEISIALGSGRLCRLLLDIYDRHQAIAISRARVVPVPAVDIASGRSVGRSILTESYRSLAACTQSDGRFCEN